MVTMVDRGWAEAWCWEKKGSWFWWFNGGIKVFCGDLRMVRPTLEKWVLEGPFGML